MLGEVGLRPLQDQRRAPPQFLELELVESDLTTETACCLELGLGNVASGFDQQKLGTWAQHIANLCEEASRVRSLVDHVDRERKICLPKEVAETKVRLGAGATFDHRFETFALRSFQ